MFGQVLMALGSFRFSAPGGMDQAKRSSKWRWPSQERIGAAPALQYTGPGEDKVTLSGTIYPHYTGGLGQVDAMRAQAGRGSPLPLVDGGGRYWGEYVILSIDETRSSLLSDGSPRKVEFEIELQRYA